MDAARDEVPYLFSSWERSQPAAPAPVKKDPSDGDHVAAQFERLVRKQIAAGVPRAKAVQTVARRTIASTHSTANTLEFEAMGRELQLFVSTSKPAGA